MQEPGAANPLIIGVLFIVRCLVPLLVMFGLSYLLRRLGLIAPPPEPPNDWNNNHTPKNSGEGGMAHAKS
jgi:hypothetical protein